MRRTDRPKDYWPIVPWGAVVVFWIGAAAIVVAVLDVVL